MAETKKVPENFHALYDSAARAARGLCPEFMKLGSR